MLALVRAQALASGPGLAFGTGEVPTTGQLGSRGEGREDIRYWGLDVRKVRSRRQGPRLPGKS